MGSLVGKRETPWLTDWLTELEPFLVIAPSDVFFPTVTAFAATTNSVGYFWNPPVALDSIHIRRLAPLLCGDIFWIVIDISVLLNSVVTFGAFTLRLAWFTALLLIYSSSIVHCSFQDDYRYFLKSCLIISFITYLFGN